MSADGDLMRGRRAIVEQTISQLRALLDSESGQDWLDDDDDAFETILHNAQTKLSHAEACRDATLWGYSYPPFPRLVQHPFMLGDADD